MANKKELTKSERKALAIKLRKLKDVSITDRKRKMYEYKYGLVDGVIKSNQVTGKKFKVTGEAVRLVIKQVEELLNK